MVIFKEGTHLVLKKDDVVKYCTEAQIDALAAITKAVNEGRVADGKPINTYYICNADEPYAMVVLATIVDGEQKKQEEEYGCSIEVLIDDPTKGIRPVQPSDIRSVKESELQGSNR